MAVRTVRDPLDSAAGEEAGAEAARSVGTTVKGISAAVPRPAATSPTKAWQREN